MTNFDPARGAAWVTGASTGLGRALALRLARGGWRVAASARSEEGLRSLASEAETFGGRIDPHPLDITDRDAVKAGVAAITAARGSIALAVLNAGTHQPMHAHDFKAETLRRLIDVNVMGQANCLEALLPDMIARKWGQIAVVSSVAGYAGLPSAAAYGLTKAGLINMCEALRPELARAGVTFQVVNPGFVKTPLTDKNEFPMPFLMPVEKAAERFYRGLESGRFEVTFPRRLAVLLKILRGMPYPLFFALTGLMAPKS